MKILLVEDDDEWVKSITIDLTRINPHSAIQTAQSRDFACAAIDGNFFDLVVLDLRIPTIDSAVDAEPAHGYAVFQHIRTKMPGTPILVLTGSPVEPFIDQLMTNTHQVDIWKTNVILPTVNFIPKYKYATVFEAIVKPYLDSFSKIFEVEVKRVDCELSKNEDRLLRIFSKSCKAVKCQVRQLNGGLSGVKVFKLHLTDLYGATIHDVVTKIGPREEVFDERNRFDDLVARLEGKATPRKLGVVEYGAGNTCGIFYHLAAGYESEAFAIALKNDDSSQKLVEALRDLTLRWREGLPELRQNIKAIREKLIADDKFLQIRASIPYTWIEDFENNAIQTRTGCTHGDMHGLNVLATEVGEPILIDYGDVGDSAVSLDPITLELSLFFHPRGPLLNSEWPTEAQAKQWGNLDVYLENCPVPIFIRACRDWTVGVAAGNREISAVTYSYLVRQLKYEGAKIDRILFLIQGAKSVFDQG